MPETSETRNARRRDGTVLKVGDPVTTDYHPACAGRVFIIERITPWPTCESGHMILVHVENELHRKLNGEAGVGLDTNWFHLHHGSTNTKGHIDNIGSSDQVRLHD